MQKLLAIILMCFILNAKGQSEEKVQGNVKSIEQFSYDIYHRNGKDEVSANTFKKKIIYSKQQKILKTLTPNGTSEYSLRTRYAYNNGK